MDKEEEKIPTKMKIRWEKEIMEGNGWCPGIFIRAVMSQSVALGNSMPTKTTTDVETNECTA